MSENTLTTANGAPVADDDHSISAGSEGPLTFDNFRLFEKLAHFNRERIPERVVHARGTGAYGHFILARGLADYTLADFLQHTGQQTEVFVRFSTVGGGQDSSDYARDPRGFAIKFYTREGNFDLVGNNTPIFFLNDPSKFPDFIHSQKKHPQTNLPDPQSVYEFWANHPQALHQLTILMSDRGIPFSYRHMHGFSSHTMSFWNAEGERFWVKWHIKTLQGIKTLRSDEAALLPSYGAQQDLIEAINCGDYPKWRVALQLLPEARVDELSVDPFDLTKVWPHGEVPLLEIGILELNRNVSNYFAETEQSAFAPSNLVPGIGASPDKMLQARLLAYQDAHRYRLGANSGVLPVNRPRCPVHHYQRDGLLAGIYPLNSVDEVINQDSSVNFFPNDRAGEGSPIPQPQFAEPPLRLPPETLVGLHSQPNDDHFSQAGALFRLMTPDQRQQLAENIAAGLHQVSAGVQMRMFEQFAQADADYAELVQTACLKFTAGTFVVSAAQALPAGTESDGVR